MEQSSIDAFTDKEREDLFAWLGIAIESVTELGGFESFLFAREDRGTILRFTHISHRTLDQILGELTWIEYLARHDAPVCTPVILDSGVLAAQHGDFIACEFERALGRTIAESDWNATLFRSWGAAMGQFHALAREFTPPAPSHRRIDWSDDPNFDFGSRLPESQHLVIERAAACRSRLLALPATSSTYGLVHCDMHPGNFHYADGQLAFFDFDDSCYCWYAYDIATSLFSAVLQPWIANSKDAQALAARAFLTPFLEGYSRRFDLPDFALRHLELFLKVRELSLYAVIHSAFDVDRLTGWYETKFMADRRRRIEADEPFLDVEFG